MRHAFDTGTEDFGEIGRAVNGEHTNAERQVGHIEADHGEPKECYVDLQEEWGSAQDIDVCHSDAAQHTAIADFHKGKQQADGNGKRKTDGGHGERDAPALKERGDRSDDDLRLAEHA